MRQALLPATMVLVSLSSAIAIKALAQTAQSPVRQVVDSVVNPWIAKDKLPGVAEKYFPPGDHLGPSTQGMTLLMLATHTPRTSQIVWKSGTSKITRRPISFTF
jgi:hypothetical protein